jgi:hypothetical protein
MPNNNPTTLEPVAPNAARGRAACRLRIREVARRGLVPSDPRRLHRPDEHLSRQIGHSFAGFYVTPNCCGTWVPE